VQITSAGSEREVPLEDLFVDYYTTTLHPGEIITSVRIPPLAPHTGSAYLKFLPRTADDYATVGVAATVTIDPEAESCQECRIALGCVGSTTLRATEAEVLLRGQRSGPELFKEAAAAAERITDPISDARGSAEYKRAMIGVFVRRALERVWTQALQRR